MSLRVWLPLNGDLHNQGLADITVTNSGATINNNGKIGKCYSFNGSSNYLSINPIFSNNNQIFSFSSWIKFNILPSESAYACLFCSRINTQNTGIGVWLKGTKCFYIDIGSRWITSAQNIEIGEWYHIAIISSNSGRKLYINGVQVDETTSIYTNPTEVNANKVLIGCQMSDANGTPNGTYFNGYMNDFRIYDHALSAKEVEEIAKGLVLHYKLDNDGMGNPNLFRGTQMRPIDRTNFVSNSSTDWTKFLRYYNGNTGLHTFTEENGIYTDTILLSQAANLGICFGRLASEISLDSSSYYTISCEAKCTKSGAGIDIGLSYLKTNDTWIWRGGSNRKLFTNTTDWQVFTHTFKPDADTKAIDYCFTVVGVSGGTDTLSIRKCKLEKGSIATPWMPAPEDLGINPTIIYDCSGYQNDGFLNNVSLNSDTSRYENSMKFSGSTSYIKVENNNWMAQYAREMTINLWAKNTTWSNGANMKFFSCTESGGWNCEAGNTGYIRFPIYVCTNAAQTSYAYKYDSTEVQASALIPDEWNMITWVYDSTGTKTYINGELHHTYSNISYGIRYNTNARLFLGCEANTANPTSPYYNGQMSDFRLYYTALTVSQIKELYNTSMSIDNKGNIHTRELIVDNSNKFSANKQGQLISNTVEEDVAVASFYQTKAVKGNTIYEY